METTTCPTCGSPDVNRQSDEYYLRSGECLDAFHADAELDGRETF